LQPFQNLLIARSVTKEIDGIPILELSITSIEPLGASATILSQDASAPENLVELPVVPFVARIDSDPSIPQSKAELRAERVTPPKLVHQVDPEFPEAERERHRGGRVAIACTIDVEGTVREPYVQASAGAAFDNAAMEVVRQYRLKPAMKYGKPMMVDTIIEIDFHPD
jgi:TonB family protein